MVIKQCFLAGQRWDTCMFPCTMCKPINANITKDTKKHMVEHDTSHMLMALNGPKTETPQAFPKAT